MPEFGTDIEEDLRQLDAKIKQLKSEYEQYFLGSRKREPQLGRGEIQRMIALYAQMPIQNTGYRFKFNNLRARFFSFRRHWDETVRKIEQGTYERHLFKAKLHEGMGQARRAPQTTARPRESGDLFEAYVSARQACGQDVGSLDREKLGALLAKQEQAIRSKFGCAEVRFKVVVEDGKAKLKALASKG